MNLRMRLHVQLRSVLSALVVALLIASVVSGECFACKAGVGRSVHAGGCCDPDGQCNSSPVPSSRCAQASPTEAAVAEQAERVTSVASAIVVCLAQDVNLLRHADRPPVKLTDSSPPDLPVLHSALLI